MKKKMFQNTAILCFVYKLYLTNYSLKTEKSSYYYVILMLKLNII